MMSPRPAATRPGCHGATAQSSAQPSQRPLPRLRWWRELALLGVVYGLYSMIRNAAPTQATQAQSNATWILNAERMLGIDVERGINGFVAPIAALAVPANYYYATLHFAVTGSVLVWLYLRRPTFYSRARSVLLGMTLMALVGYWLYPLAPPRLMTGGEYVDTVRVWETWGVASSDVVTSASNQYAAMPSMHVGWSLWSGIMLAMLARQTVVRVLGAAYPAATLLVVVCTGNHFILDAVGAVILFVIAVMAVTRFTARAPRTAFPEPIDHPVEGRSARPAATRAVQHVPPASTAQQPPTPARSMPSGASAPASARTESTTFTGPG